MKNHRGFNLIELMIAVVIVGILASIAMPSYNRYVIASSREAAQTELLQLAAIQEKIYLNSNSYATAADVTGAYDGQATGGLGWTAKTKDGKYSLACNACTQNYFSIEATPVVGTAQAGNGTLIIRVLQQLHCDFFLNTGEFRFSTIPTPS